MSAAACTVVAPAPYNLAPVVLAWPFAFVLLVATMVVIRRCQTYYDIHC